MLLSEEKAFLNVFFFYGKLQNNPTPMVLNWKNIKNVYITQINAREFTCPP